MTPRFGEPSNDGSRRSSPNPIALPLRETLPAIGSEELLFEIDRGADGCGVCRIVVLTHGKPSGAIIFCADHLGNLKRLRVWLQNCWRANLLKSDAVLNFFGAIQRQ